MIQNLRSIKLPDNSVLQVARHYIHVVRNKDLQQIDLVYSYTNSLCDL